MKRLIVLCWLVCSIAAQAQLKESMYGDQVKADVKMKYIYSFEEALQKAKKEHKLIFFNCFADWAIPCHGMNKAVFSDQKFADWMDKNFVNFIIDVTTPEGRPLAEKYNIQFQAHYLVLDEDGNIVHRIVGGCQLPEFQEKVALALNPKTSLTGMDKSYAEGDRNAKFLRNYALVLRTADESEKYKMVLDEYFSKIKKSDWPKQENWVLLGDKVKENKGEMFEYFLEHKDDFVKHNGEKAVFGKFTALYFMPLYEMASGKAYDGKKLLDMYMDFRKINLPQDNQLYILYDIAKFRGEKQFDRMMDILEQKVAKLDERTAAGLDFSLKDTEELMDAEKERVVKYYTARAEQAEGSARKEYQKVIKAIVNPEGIQFSRLPFAEALKKAGQEKKLIFIDCYTTWCGPCKMMSEQVFTLKHIGDFFNEHFVNLKIDMEKGEGRDLQKRYAVNAFPTMMLLDAEGRVVYKMVGASDSRGFMEKIRRGVLPEARYYQLKEKYDSGDRSADMMPEYLLTMGDAGELKNQNEEIRNYLNLLKGKDIFTKSTWKLYDFIAKDYKMPEFGFICENRKQFVGQIDESEVNRKIESVIFPAVISYLKGEITKEDMVQVRKLIQKAGLPEQFSVSYLDRIVSLYEKKQFTGMLDFYENKVAAIPDAHAKLNLDVLLNSLVQGASDAEKERALSYVRKCGENADPRALNTYKSLLEALTKM